MLISGSSSLRRINPRIGGKSDEKIFNSDFSRSSSFYNCRLQRPATTADVLQSSADAEEGSSHDSQGSLRTGLYAVGSLSSSASAGEEDGLIQTDVTIVAVTVDETGVITDCVIDAVQAKANFDSQGQLLTDLTVPVPSKNELGADYGMGSISGIGKEWNEQAQALADYVVGKTADEVLGIAVDEATKPAEADLASSVTISIGGFQNAIAEAVPSRWALRPEMSCGW